MDFFNQTGKVALGSRVRFLSEMITADATKLYQLYGVALQPKWFPVFYVLTQNESKSITDLAKDIRQSHASVSKIISEMVREGLVQGQGDTNDKRRNVVSLSAKGQEVAEKIKDQYIDVEAAIEELTGQANHDLWKALEEWEFLLEQKSLYQRVVEKRKAREAKRVRIVDYTPQYQTAFRALNEEWISKYFVMEAADYKALDHPQSYILDKGGHILVALIDDEPVGVCALIKMDDPEFDFELAKMAVSPKAQGRSIGWLLGNAVIEKARTLGAKGLYLESNTTLKAAISLYYKLGFVKVVGRPTPYERCNIQMSLVL